MLSLEKYLCIPWDLLMLGGKIMLNYLRFDEQLTIKIDKIKMIHGYEIC